MPLVPTELEVALVPSE